MPIELALTLAEDGCRDAPLDLAAARDPKGLYGQAKRGELPHFTGIDSRRHASTIRLRVCAASSLDFRMEVPPRDLFSMSFDI